MFDEGSTMSDLNCKNGKNISKNLNILQENEARYVIKEIANGLQHLINNKVMHRDIKIENILVDLKNHNSFQMA
jgi:serine/threonine protein kinase